MPLARGPRHGLARVLSKRGVCSRTQAARWINEGRVSVDGRVVRDPEHPIAGECEIRVDGAPLEIQAARIVLMLNKPRGLVTTARDEHGRDTVYACLADPTLPWLAPVGRLDKASEGLLLMTNDPVWAARVTDPATGPSKTYHVQVDRIPDDEFMQRVSTGADCEGEWLSATSVQVLRIGAKTAWLQVVLDEGRNRQIRRLLAAFDIGVLRLVRVAIGGLELGDLAKGAWRPVSDDEADALVSSPLLPPR